MGRELTTTRSGISGGTVGKIQITVSTHTSQCPDTKKHMRYRRDPVLQRSIWEVAEASMKFYFDWDKETRGLRAVARSNTRVGLERD